MSNDPNLFIGPFDPDAKGSEPTDRIPDLSLPDFGAEMRGPGAKGSDPIVIDRVTAGLLDSVFRDVSFNLPMPQSPEDYRSCGTEAEKCIELYLPYTLKDGVPVVGIDLASGGKPCVPWALNFDLPASEYDYYNSGQKPRQPLHLCGHANLNLPFESDSFDWVFSSHFIEDNLYEQWPRIFREWSRIVKHGGYLIVLAPDKERWNWAIQNLGQPCNCSHQFEPAEGDMARVAAEIGLEVIMDRLTDLYPHDYGLLGIFRKP